MIRDISQYDSAANLAAQVCVVGSGPVGVTLALALSRAGVDTILLESGDKMSKPAPQDLNRSEVVGRKHNGIHLGRHRVFGGASTQWGGQLLPMTPIDFERREWVPDSGWPISLQELEPFYAQAQQYEGLKQALPDEAVWQALRLRQPDFGMQLVSHLSRWCPEPDFARLHGAEISASERLTCIVNATVCALSCEGDRIDSVLAKSLTGRQLRVRAKYFVLCGGAIETARLLLHPLENQDSAPWTRSTDAIGRYFMDHPTFECADIRPRDAAKIHQLMDMIYLDGLKYQPRIHLAPSRQAETRTLNAGGVLLFKSQISAEVIGQVRTAVRQVMRDPGNVPAMWQAARSGFRSGPFILKQAWRYFVQKRALNPSDAGIRLLAFVEQAPDSDSRVSLSDELDALGMRRTRLDWRLGGAEARTLVAFATEVKTAFETLGLADVTVDSFLRESDAKIVDQCWDNFHHMGTTRMASDASQGVVDANLKLFGSVNGFVCGCSVFPTGGFANPTHTAIALAVRLADHLRPLCRI